MLYLISYDLTRPTIDDYQKLWDALRGIGARKVLLSEWMFKSTSSAVEIRDYLWQFMDGNDRLLVVSVENWASMRMMANINEI